MSIEERIPRIHVDVNMSNEDYIRWNVQGALKKLEQTPEEASTTLMVYHIHKEILRKKGVSESDFAESDRMIEEAKRRYKIEE